MDKVKKCNTCRLDLPLNSFGINNATKDKLSHRCKSCSKIKEEQKRRALGIKPAVKIEVVDNKKQCTLCKEWKFLEDYNKCSTHKLGLQTHCRLCSNRKAREYDMCPKKRRNRRLKSIFKITNEDYDRMLKEQNNRCKICDSEDTNNSSTNFLAVDHCHTTGKIRGLLCSLCNTGLGVFKDNIEVIGKAIDYLKRNQ